MTDPIVITAISRTPLGAFQGAYSTTPAYTLGAEVIRATIEETAIAPEAVEHVYMGCVLPAGQGQAPARQAALGAGLPHSAAAVTINKMCGSGMQTVIMAHDAIKAETINVAIAGGMENMTLAPYLLQDARNGLRMGDKPIIDSMMYDGLTDAYEGGAMGVFADKIAAEYQFTRKQQDNYAIESIARAQQAQTEGKFDREITPVTVKNRKTQLIVDKDEGPLKAKPEKIPTLSPVFTKDGTVTAANASSINDGAAALMLMPKSVADKGDHKILAEITAHAAYAHEPAYFTTAPVSAIKKALQKAGWETASVDLWEINEAFAVVPLIAMQELDIDHEKVNVNGGACVLGHPIGASGARIIVTLIAEMEKRNAKKGVASLCIGGGEATAICLSRP